MERCERTGDFDYLEACAEINVRVVGADIVKDVEHEGAVAGAKLVDGKVMEWIIAKLVICH